MAKNRREHRRVVKCDPDTHCSFCGAHWQKVAPLVEGPGGFFICHECVELCQAILDQAALQEQTK